MIARLIDRFLTWLSEPRWRNVAQADRFAREQAQLGCVAPGTVVEIEHVPVTIMVPLPKPGETIEVLPPPGEGMAWVQDRDGSWYRLNVCGHEECTAECCTVRAFHSPCAHQTALAAQRDAKRGAK